MAFVRVEQRNARLASDLKVEFVKGRDGEVAKGLVTIISNARRGSGNERTEEATAIQWTLWGKQAENAAEYLGKGSRVNVVGRLHNNNYDKDGVTVYGLQFTCEELDYLDSKAESQSRRQGQKEWTDAYEREEGEAATKPMTSRPGQAAPRRGGVSH
jgi:single stranded DNA-binding protein